MEIHEFLDSSKAAIATNVHRALTHNSWFISVVIPRVFGEVFKRKSDGKNVSSRDVAEQHVAEDFNGFIPSAADYLNEITMQPWMHNGNGTPPSFARVLRQRRAKPTTSREEVMREFIDKYVPITPLSPPMPLCPPSFPKLPLIDNTFVD